MLLKTLLKNLKKKLENKVQNLKKLILLTKRYFKIANTNKIKKEINEQILKHREINGFMLNSKKIVVIWERNG